jgi:hypothetical protein
MGPDFDQLVRTVGFGDEGERVA